MIVGLAGQPLAAEPPRLAVKLDGKPAPVYRRTVSQVSVLKARVRKQIGVERLGAWQADHQPVVLPAAPTVITPSKTRNPLGGSQIGWPTQQAMSFPALLGARARPAPSVVAVTPPPEDPTPDLEDNFSTYSSTANMLADPLGIISEGEDSNPSQIVLDGTDGVTALGLTKSMRLDYPDQHAEPCGGYTVGRNYSFASNQSEVWVEVYVKFGPTWEIYPAEMDAVCGDGYNPDFKLFFGRMTIDSRFEVLGGNSINGNVVSGYPGNEPAYQNLTQIGPLLDGTYHRWRMHWKYSTTAGIVKLWIDSTRYLNATGIAMPSGKGLIYGLAVGRNRDPRPGVAQSLYIGRIRAWYGGNDPGWT